ncbi:hypothetical protein VFPPC_17459 [Pochonia chlamydosporia 170]|uniref:Uncharacterized protein n=1 Tax=Pochonia chlamydosporia 170 TaxID=1380566 RepID=A0A219ARG8_METCM|nr:hypothetical protein VFPPC_17459 [Pochonia chlamydosporia 170]OWT43378.1 hypothetical protein VFPPC_17459 [Pochonia chlamydosporia 170]
MVNKPLRKKIDPTKVDYHSKVSFVLKAERDFMKHRPYRSKYGDIRHPGNRGCYQCFRVLGANHFREASWYNNVVLGASRRKCIKCQFRINSPNRELELYEVKWRNMVVLAVVLCCKGEDIFSLLGSKLLEGLPKTNYQYDKGTNVLVCLTNTTRRYFPVRIFDPEKPEKGSYAWIAEDSLRQLESLDSLQTPYKASVLNFLQLLGSKAYDRLPHSTMRLVDLARGQNGCMSETHNSAGRPMSSQEEQSTPSEDSLRIVHRAYTIAGIQVTN